MSKYPAPIDHQHYDHETASSICTFPFTTIVHRYLRQQHLEQQEAQP